MSETAFGKAKEALISVVIIRCGCNNPATHIGSTCPKGRIEDRGVVSYWHKNPFKRLNYWFKTKVLKEIYD